MSVPNWYWAMMMLMPSLEYEDSSSSAGEPFRAVSIGVVMPRSTSPGAAPGCRVTTVRRGNLRSGISS
jgi:hypothetical protein